MSTPEDLHRPEPADPVARLPMVEATLREAAQHRRFIRVHFRADPPAVTALVRADSWHVAPKWYDSVVVGITWWEDDSEWEPFVFHVGAVDDASFTEVPAESVAKLRAS